MPVKLNYTPEMYAVVTSTLYAFFGSIGAGFQVAAFVSAIALAYASRKLPSFGLVVTAALLLGASLVVWAAMVAPVNAAWAEASRSGARSPPGPYAQLRTRWEYGHVAAFVSWLAGYGLLQWFAPGGHANDSHGRNAA